MTKTDQVSIVMYMNRSDNHSIGVVPSVACDYFSGSTRIRVGHFCMIQERWQKMRNNLHRQVLFIAEAIRLALDDANRVVQSLAINAQPLEKVKISIP